MSDYEVGYGKPPKHGQFKKGTSGNKKGRPKTRSQPLIPRQVRKILLRVMEEPVTVQTSKGPQKMSGHEMVIRSVLHRAAAGNPTALKLWTSWAMTAVNERFQRHGSLQLLDSMLDAQDREKLGLHKYTEDEEYDLIERTKHLI